MPSNVQKSEMGGQLGIVGKRADGRRLVAGSSGSSGSSGSDVFNGFDGLVASSGVVGSDCDVRAACC